MQREFLNLCINTSQLNQAVLGRQILGSNQEYLNVYKNPNWNEERVGHVHKCISFSHFLTCVHARSISSFTHAWRNLTWPLPSVLQQIRTDITFLLLIKYKEDWEERQRAKKSIVCVTISPAPSVWKNNWLLVLDLELIIRLLPL